LSSLRRYLEEFQTYKASLLALYARENCRFERKTPARACGTTWGYRLTEWNGRRMAAKAAGTSIGEDEIRILYDLAQLTDPTNVYVIGNAFGFSTCCIALAAPRSRVIAIDNWSEGENSLLARDLTAQIVASNSIKNVYVHTGSSPNDTRAALTCAGLADRDRLSWVFIDGMHTDSAATQDFVGVLPYLDHQSIVLWHNAYSIRNAFRDTFAGPARKLFDHAIVLRSYGPLGVFYNSAAHPLLHAYFTEFSLIWNGWERIIGLLKAGESTSNRKGLRRVVAQIWPGAR
jgi:predicted O-methyltransferase YrrM